MKVVEEFPFNTPNKQIAPNKICQNIETFCNFLASVRFFQSKTTMKTTKINTKNAELSETELIIGKCKNWLGRYIIPYKIPNKYLKASFNVSALKNTHAKVTNENVPNI